ncbi:Hypothetical protein SRAE_1000348800 [Strongyloides ratti]|uniref:Uncharacterized protein n=1 Tax=Strongyloides ratti TaxID=34506 RepID=A0A090LCM6_STRRB|nr:Hypothetical protein SRAE_1000348800 [Strongyloides ratti]CEF65235.1 Hypothetical protein SRAE_1000348800 [Strongyloides ratti]
MISKSRSRSNSRKVSNAPNRITAQISEEFSVISNGKRDTFQTTINKTGYLGDISSAAIIEKSKMLTNGKLETFENKIEPKSITEKTENSETVTDWTSNILIKRPLNVYNKEYQSFCIDDTTNGTLLFNNTELINLPNTNKKIETFKINNSTKSFQTIDSSSDGENFITNQSKRFSFRKRSKSFKRENSKDRNCIKLNNETTKVLHGTKNNRTTVNVSSCEDLTDKTYTTTSQQTTLGFYSEFKNEYEHLLDENKILGEVSSSYNSKIDTQILHEPKFRKFKKAEDLQPSPILKEKGIKMTEIDCKNLKKLYSIEKKNTSIKYNRLTFAEQLEMTFKNTDIQPNINDPNALNFLDKLNHTYRNSLEETIPNFNIQCLANSTRNDELLENLIYDDIKLQELQSIHLSKSFDKDVDLNLIQLEVEKNEMLFAKQQFSHVNDCATEMVRQCSNTKIATIINTPTTISDIEVKKSEITSDNNVATTTRITQDIYSIKRKDKNKTETENLKYEKTIKKQKEQVDKDMEMTKKTYKVPPLVLKESQQGEKNSFVDSSIINDFRDEMIQSVYDVCDFLSQKVKNDTAVNLVEERFMENAKFLYKFFFHSCRESD